MLYHLGCRSCSREVAASAVDYRPVSGSFNGPLSPHQITYSFLKGRHRASDSSGLRVSVIAYSPVARRVRPLSLFYSDASADSGREIARSALSLARSAQAERDNESCFFVCTADVQRFIRLVNKDVHDAPATRSYGVMTSPGLTVVIELEQVLTEARMCDLLARRLDPPSCKLIANESLSALLARTTPMGELVCDFEYSSRSDVAATLTVNVVGRPDQQRTRVKWRA
ncbi:hypothetical protein EVAR_18104_1 [Eumeta japonica]|uniref:Uncharacterized protein n=1 Tax=Eumeta variegata TaxID=151549 RepID=A0A4C1VKH3_EUMVA|nr:hypothetical protein EVAR_18104_1 [Eumeta japonica]